MGLKVLNRRILKGTVSVIPCIDDNIGLTTVPLMIKKICMIKYELELKTDYFQLWFLYKSDRSIKHNGTIEANYFRSDKNENIFQIIDRNRFQGHRCESDIDICIYAFSSFKINSAA